MDIRLLDYFIAVAEEHSVTGASRRLFVAQSTVSAGVRSLERDLGVVLFDRSGRGLRLTPQGEVLLRPARTVVDDMERFRGLAGAQASGIRGRLRLGTYTAMETLIGMPEVLQRFHREYPGVDVRLVVSQSGSTGLAAGLEKGRLDVIFLSVPPVPAFDVVEVLHAPYVALVPENDVLATAGDISLTSLAGRDWVDVLPGYGNRLQVERACADVGVRRRVVAEVAGLPDIPAYVAAGLGVALVPDMLPAAGCVCLPVVEPLPEWHLWLAVRRDGLRRPQVGALVKMLRDAIQRRYPDRLTGDSIRANDEIENDRLTRTAGNETISLSGDPGETSSSRPTG